MGQAPQEKGDQMKEIFWNVRGLGKKGRQQRISDLCRQTLLLEVAAFNWFGSRDFDGSR
jgi:hypothetical protein